jgi:transcriptional regulator with XRE-family HTH domain
MTILHQNLKILRNLKKVSRREVAKALNMKIRNYEKYEEGRANPKYEKLVELAEFYGVTTDFLITGKNSVITKWDESENVSPWERAYNLATMATRYNVNKLLNF